MEDLLFQGHYNDILIKDAEIIKKDAHFEVSFIVTSKDFHELVESFNKNKMPPCKLDCTLGKCILSLVDAKQNVSGKCHCIFIDLS